MDQKHSPLPWKVFRAKNEAGTLLGVGRADTAEGITDCRGGLWGDESEALANAELIVEAVNSHAAHLTTIEAQARTIEAMREKFQQIIARSWSGELGTSKVIDMREIAKSALALTQPEDRDVTEKPSGWQPIETAPKDGTQVLLAGRDMYGADDPGGARWRIATGRWDTDFRTGGDWIGTGSHYPPSHWQPLTPPELEDKTP